MCYAVKAGLTVALVCLVALPGRTFAASNATGEQTHPVKEKADQLLNKTCNALAALTGYSFHAEVTLDNVHQDGSKIQTGRSMSVAVQRPAAFKIVTDGDDFQAASVFDGKTFSLALTDRNIYGQVEAAMNTDALMELLATKYGIESPLGDLLSNAPCVAMNSDRGYYVGKAKVDGAVCDHLFFQGADVDWQLWVEDGPLGLPRKIVITEKNLPMAPQFTAILSSWKTEDNGAELFAFTAPKGFTRDDGVITGAKSKE